MVVQVEVGEGGGEGEGREGRECTFCMYILK